MHLTQAKLKELFDYNPETGLFTRLTKDSNRTKIGDVVSSLDGRGYLRVGINKVRYSLHRLAFLYMTGEMPKEQVDHINENRTDNRFWNLRLANCSENLRNKSIQKNNTTGFKGVRFRRGKFTAQISCDGMQYYLGVFDTANDAHQAYVKAAKKLHGVFANFGKNDNKVKVKC